MHVRIFDLFQVECLSVDTIFVFRLCLHFLAPQQQLFKGTSTCAGYDARREKETGRTPRPADDLGALFTASPRVKWRAGFEECRWDDGPVCDACGCRCVCVCVCGFKCDCLPPFLICAQIYGNLALWPSCPRVKTCFFFFWRLKKKKLLHSRLQVLFLTWSFLSRIVINIYFYISVK